MRTKEGRGKEREQKRKRGKERDGGKGGGSSMSGVLLTAYHVSLVPLSVCLSYI